MPHATWPFGEVMSSENSPDGEAEMPFKMNNC